MDYLSTLIDSCELSTLIDSCELANLNEILSCNFVFIVWTFSGYTEHLQNGFEGTNSNVGQIAIGFYSSMWAYDGWLATLCFFHKFFYYHFTWVKSSNGASINSIFKC